MTAVEALTINKVPLGMHIFKATDQAPMISSSRCRQENDLFEKKALSVLA